LLTYLLRIRETEEILESRLKGNMFENMIVAEYQKQNYHRYLHREYYFWQDSNGNEVDLLLQNHDDFDVFEIKATQTLSSALFRQLDKFEQLASPSKVNKTLIYAGEENQQRSGHRVVGWQNITG
jgi:predicted AAA+ superfamily ATPase